MKNNIQFQSSFAQHMTNYIKEKESLGFKSLEIRYILADIDRFLYSAGTKEIDEHNFNAWISTRINDSEETLRRKYMAMANFCRYLSYMGVTCYIPTVPRIKKKNFTPTIFTKNQIEAIFNSCDSMCTKSKIPKSIIITLPTIVRLLYSTGIRISEALSLKNKDLHLDDNYIVLNQTKNKAQRLIPINLTMKVVLEQYLRYRNQIPIVDISAPDRHLFVSLLGTKCSRESLLHYFHKILRDAGIPRYNNQLGPRLHDLRHTCAVHSLIKANQSGCDLYNYLPYLSVFLGHKNIYSTEKYLRLSAEVYPEITMNNSELNDLYNNVISSHYENDETSNH